MDRLDKVNIQDQINIILHEYKNQCDWQRHNEIQRAQLTTVLLTISAALVAFLQKDLKREDWPVPTFLIGIGIFGVLAVLKYWERFRFHAQLEQAYREILDLYFSLDDTTSKHYKSLKYGDQKLKEYLLISTRQNAIQKHNQEFPHLFQDRNVMQHWLWIGVFILITLLGIVLLMKSLSN